MTAILTAYANAWNTPEFWMGATFAIVLLIVGGAVPGLADYIGNKSEGLV